MKEVKFRVGKKYMRGVRKGRRNTETVKLNSKSAIHSYLWDLTDQYESEKCNYIVEWYVLA